MLGQRDTWCAEGLALIHQLGDYFRRESLVELYGANSYDIVSGGAIRAYCYDHDLNVPPELSGAMMSAEEGPAFWRKMQRDMVATSDAAPEALPDRPASMPDGGRKHGGARPEVEYIERYVSACQQRGLTLLAMKNGFVRHVRERIEAKDPECPFIAFNPTRSIFTVWGAGGVREASLASTHRSIGSAYKKLSGVSKCKQVSRRLPAAEPTMEASYSDGGRHD